jgi:cell fate (sporulation/competence/biofilm development) regulator YlbF (YheA/YmcA/DUF963 family)
MNKIMEMAQELGQALGRTDEYRALARAAEGIEEERRLLELRNELERLEGEMVTLLRSGQEPDETQKERYEELARELQATPEYQRLIAAQTNFDKILQKVNETISNGIQEGGKSRIILPS